MKDEREYTISIVETLEKAITVKASSLEEATSKVEDMYNSEEVVLDSSDFSDVEFVSCD